MKKRGSSLAMNIVIVAVILLVVLIVIIAIFGNSIKNWIKGTKNCETLGGTCMNEGNSSCIKHIPDAKCNGNKICCMTLPV